MKAATENVTIEGVSVNIPANCEWDGKAPAGFFRQPSEECKRIMDRHSDPRGWKYPVGTFVTESKRLAVKYAACLDFYLGGHETREADSSDGKRYFCISSRGYYHYIGA